MFKGILNINGSHSHSSSHHHHSMAGHACSSSSPSLHMRVETLVCDTRLDMERAMAGTTLPKRVDIRANLISTTSSKGDMSLTTKLLKRVGCKELCLYGASGAAPRRVFEHEIVAVLNSIPRGGHKLRKVILKNLDVQRRPNNHHHHPQLQDRLEKLSHLDELHVQSCRLEESSTLMDLLEALPRLLNLTQITLHLVDPIADARVKSRLIQTMTTLLSSKQHRLSTRMTCLTSMAISEYPPDLSFWWTIAASKTLTHLSLACRHNNNFRDVDAAADNNNNVAANVRSSHHRSQQQDKGDDGDSTVMAAQDAHHYTWELLHQNTSLQQLELQVEAGMSLISPLCQLLRRNTTLTSLLLHLEEDPTALTTALTGVLELDNFTLQNCHLFCHNIYGYKVRIPCPRLDFFTRLNRNGRYQLFVRGLDEDDHHDQHDSHRSRSSQEGDVAWVDTVASNPYDISAVYYWLQSNPNLFSHTKYGSSSTTATTKPFQAVAILAAH